jgi:diguanylate cyclase (GGDEF)-like protein
LLPQTSRDEALQVAERIRATCEEEPHTPHCTVSIGVAISTGGTCSQDTLLGRADAALYRAKANGRNRVEI